mmetsp:Transcript_135926/g.271167  ORF Transcript_135926/g.271167 Transcript_135926/m.271167 type:complete len:112 (+) Transcript_135926:238-573(+)
MLSKIANIYIEALSGYHHPLLSYACMQQTPKPTASTQQHKLSPRMRMQTHTARVPPSGSNSDAPLAAAGHATGVRHESQERQDIVTLLSVPPAVPANICLCFQSQYQSLQN